MALNPTPSRYARLVQCLPYVFGPLIIRPAPGRGEFIGYCTRYISFLLFLGVLQTAIFVIRRYVLSQESSARPQWIQRLIILGGGAALLLDLTFAKYRLGSIQGGFPLVLFVVTAAFSSATLLDRKRLQGYAYFQILYLSSLTFLGIFSLRGRFELPPMLMAISIGMLSFIPELSRNIELMTLSKSRKLLQALLIFPPFILATMSFIGMLPRIFIAIYVVIFFAVKIAEKIQGMGREQEPQIPAPFLFPLHRQASAYALLVVVVGVMLSIV